MKDLLNPFKFDLQLFADGGEGDPSAGDPKNDPKDPPVKDQPKEPDNKLQMTQEELDTLIAKRLERERKKYEGFDDMKTKLAEYEKELEEKRLAELTEKERAEELAKKAEEEKQTLAQQLETLQKQVQQEKIANEFIKQATAHNIAYIDDALKLADLSAVKVNEDGKVEGVEEAVKVLVENKPFLVKQTKEPKQIGGGSQTKVPGDKTKAQVLEELKQTAIRTQRIEDRMAYAKAKQELS